MTPTSAQTHTQGAEIPTPRAIINARHDHDRQRQRHAARRADPRR